ncbi:GSCFA domain-containing protein [Phocaeicola sp.]|uniref:GSCFA domain-containing protein n=1 Tax=Phocaeicola sp. TaxID=2773926 RepID=UPI003AB17563
MEFRTKVELPVGQGEIRHSDSISLWGSCFAENIGKLLSDNKFDCDVNPFGVLYNPLSIAKSMSILLDGKTYHEKDLRFDKGIWYSLMHHSSFSSTNQSECLEKINLRIVKGREMLGKARWIIFTWGTARVYEWKETGEIVGNCHKLPDRLFTRRLLGVEEVVSVFGSLLKKIHLINPDAQFLFTVSPIRHAKDGMHGNQLNKAVLLLAIEKLCREIPSCHYFPSYEIMLDELRDYRFYADDMLHPTPLAVNYIWECFCSSFFTADTLRIMKDWQEIRKALEHRPFDAKSDEL